MSDPLLLMTPGPTRVPDRVLAAGARPMIHHRTPEFARIHAAVLEGLRPLFGTEKPMLPVYATGRGAMEAGIANLFSPGDAIIVSCNGRFGEMWADLATAYGLTVHRVATDWSLDLDPGEVEQAFRAHRNVRGVAVTMSDTGTGVLNDVPAVAAIAGKHHALMLVDGISAIGGLPFRFDEWQLDYAVTGSQKCLMCAPGVSFAAISERAWKATESARCSRNYWNLTDYRASLIKGDLGAHRTSPVHLFMQVAEALALINEEGQEAVFRRHAALAELTRRRAAQLGLKLQCPQHRKLSPTVTSLAVPAGVSPKTIRDGLRARGILVAGGLGKFEAASFRIGHMGDIRIEDVSRTMDALAEVLEEARLPAGR